MKKQVTIFFAVFSLCLLTALLQSCETEVVNPWETKDKVRQVEPIPVPDTGGTIARPEFLDHPLFTISWEMIKNDRIQVELVQVTHLVELLERCNLQSIEVEFFEKLEIQPDPIIFFYGCGELSQELPGHVSFAKKRKSMSIDFIYQHIKIPYCIGPFLTLKMTKMPPVRSLSFKFWMGDNQGIIDLLVVVDQQAPLGADNVFENTQKVKVISSFLEEEVSQQSGAIKIEVRHLKTQKLNESGSWGDD